MLPIMLRITLGVGLVLYFTVILLFLKYKAIELKYTLIWIFCGVAMLLMVIFPKLLTFFIESTWNCGDDEWPFYFYL